MPALWRAETRAKPMARLAIALLNCRAAVLTKGRQWCVCEGRCRVEEGREADDRLFLCTTHTPPLATALPEGSF